jgi:hypothetical protein
LVSCDCCDTPICRRCIREVRTDVALCPACAEMRPPTRSEARQHGRWLSTRGMLIGTDPCHTVVVEQSKVGWARQGDEDEKIPIADHSVARFLAERLASPDTTSAES